MPLTSSQLYQARLLKLELLGSKDLMNVIAEKSM